MLIERAKLPPGYNVPEASIAIKIEPG
ncbi:hypothetical protein [Bradyrhizobium sp. RT6a]